jgi:predicted transcriptional regulator
MTTAFAGAWNAHQAKSYLSQQLPLLLKDRLADDIRQPNLAIAGPAIEHLRYVLHEPAIANMLARLLAVAMDGHLAPQAHPAFVNIIANLSADEARLLMYFLKDEPLSLITLRWDYSPESSKQGGKEVLQNFSHLALRAQCLHPQLCATYVDNLCRLGLVEIPPFYQYLEESYADIEADPLVRSLITDIESSKERVAAVERKGLRITTLGKQFIRTCLQ